MTIAYEYRPGSLYLNLTNRCSNDCVFCVRQRPGFSLGGYSMRLASEPEADKVLAAVEAARPRRGERFREVVFCGFGEPGYRLDTLTQVGRALRARGLRVRLNTNGQAALITGRDPLPQLETALDSVNISLNAPDATSYEELCQPSFGAAAWPAVLDFARRCADSRLAVTLSAVGFVLDDEQVQRCRALARELGGGFRER